jgi:hypothetical protein
MALSDPCLQGCLFQTISLNWPHISYFYKICFWTFCSCFLDARSHTEAEARSTSHLVSPEVATQLQSTMTFGLAWRIAYLDGDEVPVILLKSPWSEEAIFQKARSNDQRLDYAGQKMEQKKAKDSMQQVSMSTLPSWQNAENQGLQCITSAFGDEPRRMLRTIQRFGKQCSFHLQGLQINDGQTIWTPRTTRED